MEVFIVIFYTGTELQSEVGAVLIDWGHILSVCNRVDETESIKFDIFLATFDKPEYHLQYPYIKI